MLLTAFTHRLHHIDALHFATPDGQQVPTHFHITEAGLRTKHFIDCGGTVRQETKVTLQLWVAGDTEHRLTPARLLSILQIAEPLFGQVDHAIEIEYQAETIGRYGVAFDGVAFVLQPLYTDCLAEDACGIPPASQKSKQMFEIGTFSNACTPGSGCC
jgi:Family of unknown function (DUF6428)